MPVRALSTKNQGFPCILQDFPGYSFGEGRPVSLSANRLNRWGQTGPSGLMPPARSPPSPRRARPPHPALKTPETPKALLKLSHRYVCALAFLLLGLSVCVASSDTTLAPQRTRPVAAAERLPWDQIYWRMAFGQTPTLQSVGTQWRVECNTSPFSDINVGADPQPGGIGTDCNDSDNWVPPFSDDCLANSTDDNLCSVFLTYADYVYTNPSPWNQATMPTIGDRISTFSAQSASLPQMLIADQFSGDMPPGYAHVSGIKLTTSQWLLTPGVFYARVQYAELMPAVSVNTSDASDCGTLAFLQDPDAATLGYCVLASALGQDQSYDPSTGDVLDNLYASYFASNPPALQANQDPGQVSLSVDLTPDMFSALPTRLDPFRDTGAVALMALVLVPEYATSGTPVLRQPVQLLMAGTALDVTYNLTVNLTGITSGTASRLALVSQGIEELELIGADLPDPSSHSGLVYTCGFFPEGLTVKYTTTGTWNNATSISCRVPIELLTQAGAVEVGVSLDDGQTYSLVPEDVFTNAVLCDALEVDEDQQVCPADSTCNDSTCSCYQHPEGAGGVSFCNGNGQCSLESGDCVCSLGFFNSLCTSSCSQAFAGSAAQSCETCIAINTTQCQFCSHSRTCGGGCDSTVLDGPLLTYFGIQSACPSTLSVQPNSLALNGSAIGAAPGSGGEPVSVRVRNVDASLASSYSCVYSGTGLTRDSSTTSGLSVVGAAPDGDASMLLETNMSMGSPVFTIVRNVESMSDATCGIQACVEALCGPAPSVPDFTSFQVDGLDNGTTSVSVTLKVRSDSGYTLPGLAPISFGTLLPNSNPGGPAQRSPLSVLLVVLESIAGATAVSLLVLLAYREYTRRKLLGILRVEPYSTYTAFPGLPLTPPSQEVMEQALGSERRGLYTRLYRLFVPVVRPASQSMQSAMPEGVLLSPLLNSQVHYNPCYATAALTVIAEHEHERSLLFRLLSRLSIPNVVQSEGPLPDSPAAPGVPGLLSDQPRQVVGGTVDDAPGAAEIQAATADGLTSLPLPVHPFSTGLNADSVRFVGGVGPVRTQAGHSGIRVTLATCLPLVTAWQTMTQFYTVRLLIVRMLHPVLLHVRRVYKSGFDPIVSQTRSQAARDYVTDYLGSGADNDFVLLDLDALETSHAAQYAALAAATHVVWVARSRINRIPQILLDFQAIVLAACQASETRLPERVAACIMSRLLLNFWIATYVGNPERAPQLEAVVANLSRGHLLRVENSLLAMGCSLQPRTRSLRPNSPQDTQRIGSDGGSGEDTGQDPEQAISEIASGLPEVPGVWWDFMLERQDTDQVGGGTDHFDTTRAERFLELGGNLWARTISRLLAVAMEGFSTSPATESQYNLASLISPRSSVLASNAPPQSRLLQLGYPIPSTPRAEREAIESPGQRIPSQVLSVAYIMLHTYAWTHRQGLTSWLEQNGSKSSANEFHTVITALGPPPTIHNGLGKEFIPASIQAPDSGDLPGTLSVSDA